MKPQAISNLNSNYNSQSNQNLNVTQTNLLKHKSPSDSVSFGAAPKLGIMDKIKGGLTTAFKFTDGLNFFFEFLIVDSISMILPRIWVGLNRDKDKTGHYNIKAAKEEAGRELTSGPSMNLIPMGILAGVCAFKPATKIDRKTLKGLDDLMTDITKNNPKDKESINKQLAEKIFDEIFSKDGKEPEANFAKISEHKEDFCNKLIQSTKEKKSIITFNKDENAYCKAEKSFKDLVEELNNMRQNAPTNTLATSVGGDGNNAKSLFNDFRIYSKDIVEKFTKTGKSVAEMTKNRLHVKTATALAAFLAVGSFLLLLPKLYQQKGGSPAHESAERARRETKGVA